MYEIAECNFAVLFCSTSVSQLLVCTSKFRLIPPDSKSDYNCPSKSADYANDREYPRSIAFYFNQHPSGVPLLAEPPQSRYAWQIILFTQRRTINYKRSLVVRFICTGYKGVAEGVSLMNTHTHTHTHRHAN